VSIEAPATFTVTGEWLSVNDPSLTAPASDPQIEKVNALVTFTPRLPSGFVAHYKGFEVPGDTPRVADTGIVLTQRLGRIWLGQLCAVDVVDSPGVVLVADDPKLNLAEAGIKELIYDVFFSKVQFGSLSGSIRPFAFKAPAGAATICLTSPDLERLPWQNSKS